MKRQIARTGRGTIEYTLRGSGPLVLVCHGASSDCACADGYAPLLESGHAVLTPSRPGYGRTPLETGPSAGEAADALVALLDSLGIATCAVMAISAGGPTAVSLAARHPERVRCLLLMAALTRTEGRAADPSYQSQRSFYGPLHGVMWGTLRLFSRLTPRAIARQTLAIFSSHDPDDALRRLSPEDIAGICRFYQRRSSRLGALSDLSHTAGKELLGNVQAPELVVHSREDRAVPFRHAEWSLANIPRTELVEAGFTGHFYWTGADYQRIGRRMAAFLSRD